MGLLTQIGLANLVARTPKDYFGIAVELAGDPDRLAATRAGLRDRMTISPLCDAKTFAQNLEKAYREMWRQWCIEQKPSDNQPDAS